jgi:spheroidene monooxygenase
MAVPHLDGSEPGEVAVLVLAQMAAGRRYWGWWRMVRGPGTLLKERGVRLAKVLGSGHGGGFGLRPSASRFGLFLLFGSEADAHAFIDRSPQMQAWRDHASECCIAVLKTTSARGQWSGQRLEVTPSGVSPDEDSSGPVAALTRASIRPSRAAAFWRHAPPSQQALETAAGCRLAVGLGEAPLLRQATFSVWDSAADLQAYARGAAHGAAARAAYADGCFSESLFARFQPLSLQGIWKGQTYA